MVKNASHTLAYSLIALQELNLAYRYPTIFWNCACLIADSSGEEGEDYEETDELNMDDGENSVTESNEETEDMDADDDDSATEDDDEEDVSASSTGKKTTKKAKPTNYDKIAKALNKMIQEGVTIVPPNINTSDFTFSPDPSTNSIIYGLKGIARINKDIIQNIFSGRPYSGLHDFLSKVKVTKPQMTNLIKSGAFDIFGDRVEIMKDYILSISDQKKRITLQNMAMLIEKKLLPESLSHEISVFNFNKYLKKHKAGANYELDEIASVFYDKHYDIDLTFFENEVRYVKQADWDKIYKKEMDKARDYLKANSAELLVKLNNQLYQETYDKYASGSLSKWEMDSICFYYHPHELAAVHRDIYEFANFFKMSEDPIIDRTFEKGGKKIPIFKTFRFAGTVLAKDKGKGIVTILTTDGVVSVRIFKNQFAEFDKQISERGLDGKKHVVEKSWFSRGNKIMVNGFRRGNDLVLKKYKNTPYPVLSLITEINDDGTLEYKSEREVE